MARLEVSTTIIEDFLFGIAKHPVRVTDARWDPIEQKIAFEIEGIDIPADATHVQALITLQQNRAGQRLHEMTFSKIK